MVAPRALVSKADFTALNLEAFSTNSSGRARIRRFIEEHAKRTPHSVHAAIDGEYFGDHIAVIADLDFAEASDAELEAFLQQPEQVAHPVEVVSACLNLMWRMEARDGLLGVPNVCPAYTGALRYDEVQHTLSRTLVFNPVLMNNRLVFGTPCQCNPQVQLGYKTTFLGVSAILANLVRASLPSASHGITDRQLRLFAATECTARSFVLSAPETLPQQSAVQGTLPHRIALNTEWRTQPPGIKPRGRYLVSLLELNDAAKRHVNKPLLDLAGNKLTDGEMVYSCLARVFWDVAADGGRESGVTRDELLKCLRLQSPFARESKHEAEDLESDRTVANAIGLGREDDSQLRYALSQRVVCDFFGVEGTGLAAKVKSLHTSGDMRERTRNTLSCLVQSAVFPDMAAATQWLGSISCGGLKMDTTDAAAPVQLETIVGFMEAFHDVGHPLDVRHLQEAGKRAEANNGGKPGQVLSVEIISRWQQAYELVELQASMHKQIKAGAALAPAVAAPEHGSHRRHSV